jgi:hypothetical protein
VEIQETLDQVAATLAEVGVTIPAGAYLFSNDPAHAQPWNREWITQGWASPAGARQP